MEREKRPESAGLKWRTRATGPDVPYWFASEAAVKVGYPVKSSNLREYAGRPSLLVERCERLQSEMNLWMVNRAMPERKFDGTFKHLLERYQTDPKSPFNRKLKPGVRRSYLVYIKKLISHIGALAIAKSDGTDVMDWFVDWRVGDNGKDQLAAACMALSVLKAGVSFGIICRLEGVKAFQDILAELEFPKPKSRKHAPTAQQITAARLAAHKHGAPERALVYALQFETTARQWDFIGIWLPLSDVKVSAIIDRRSKWVGPHCSDIKDMTLTIKPTKTEDSTEVEMTFDLSACPMVVEELAHFARQDGPLIVNHKTGLPYRPKAFTKGWRKDYKAADIPEEVWNRDTRAGGITEGRLSGALKEDRRRLTKHASEEQAEDYERGTIDLEAHRNVMAARRQFRAKNGT